MAGDDEEVNETKAMSDHSTNWKVGEALSPKCSAKVADIGTEVAKMRAYSETDIKNRDSEITLLRSQLSEKDILLKKLEDETERGKESVKKLVDSFGEQTKELTQTKILLEEAKIEIAALKNNNLDASEDGHESTKEQTRGHEGCDVDALKMELQSTKENLARANEAAEVSSLKASNLQEEMNLVKNELNLATKAEMNSKKAMDDLALALKEVATDCSQVKERLVTTDAQLEAAKLEASELKEKLEATEQTYKTLLQETRKETDLHKNTSERLRMEAEESMLAWNSKEAVFVNCIKRGEDEKNSLLDENNRLLQALVSAENLSKKAKEENHKLRDILKQAINEANVAKEAAGIARAENSQLKDALLDKEEELKLVLQENERIRQCEAAANEKVRELKRLLSEAAKANELKAGEKERNDSLSSQNSCASSKEQSKRLSQQNSMRRDQEVEKKNDKREDKKEKKEDKKDEKKEKQEQQKEKKEENYKEEREEKKMGKTCSFSLRELKIPNKNKEITATDDETKAATNSTTHHHHQQENTDESDEYSPGSDSDLFKGSIFDVAETPDAATTHQRKKSCTFIEDGETIIPEDLENYQLDEGCEGDKTSRKKRAFIRRFGDLLGRRKSFHKKEASSDQQEKQTQPQSHSQSQSRQPSPQPQPQALTQSQPSDQ